MECVIVGAGVSGLSTGIRLREAGWDANIVTRDMPEDTVSAVAAAVWTVTGLDPVERTRRWALASRREFARLSADPNTGVRPLRQLEVVGDPADMTGWEDTPWVTWASSDDLPAGADAGWWVDGFVIETPRYLPWLVERFRSLGGTVARGSVAALEGLAPLVVNCAGLGAGPLADDPTMYPIRGQVVIVDGAVVEEGVADYSGSGPPAYVYPRSADTVVGGTQEVGSLDPEPDPATSGRILRAATRLVDDVSRAAIRDIKVGLRPGRPEVRVEAEVLASGTRVVHAYGHGGSGYILSWGCADEVVRLAGAGA